MNAISRPTMQGADGQGALLALRLASADDQWDVNKRAHYRDIVHCMIADQIRSTDTVIVLGGNLFAVFVAGANQEHGRDVADRILAASVLTICEFSDWTQHAVELNVEGVRCVPVAAFEKLCHTGRKHAQMNRNGTPTGGMRKARPGSMGASLTGTKYIAAHYAGPNITDV